MDNYTYPTEEWKDMHPAHEPEDVYEIVIRHARRLAGASTYNRIQNGKLASRLMSGLNLTAKQKEKASKKATLHNLRFKYE